MKHLTKGPEPAVLVANGPRWTSRYIEAGTALERKRNEHWRHPEIKRALTAETGGLCAYCEGQTGDVSYAHVEHIVPKSSFPELAHTWTNLTSACAPCNVAKDRYWSETQPVVNPYEEDPASFLKFPGGLVDWVSGESRGEMTVTALDLNRPELLKSRAARIMTLKRLFERWNDAVGMARETAELGIRIDVARGEFSQAATFYLRQEGFPI